MSYRNVPIPDEPSGPPPSNRRATVRYHCAPATPGRIELPPRQEMQRGWVLDVSLGGVGVLLGRPLEPGQPVVLCLSGQARGQAYELPARVAHATREPGGEWVIGCHLDRELTRDELDDLLF
jgi:hypothetical protein